MRTSTLPVFISGIVLFAGACGQANEPQAFRQERAAAVLDLEVASPTDGSGAGSAKTDPRNALSSSAATYTDTSRRFIRSGDLRFRTDDVVRTSFAIEQLIARAGGYVASTHLSTEVNQRYQTPISADSLLETTKFNVINRITVRVPSAVLDTTLRSLIGFVDFLDHRTLSATDVRIALLRDKLTTKRLARHTERLSEAIDEQGKKLKETVHAEDRLIDRQVQADEAALNTMELEDRIAYSTLTLDIYQREEVRRELRPNEQNIAAFEPSFFSKAGEALHDGWELLQDITLAGIRSWSAILLAVVAVFLFRRFWRKA